MKTVNYLLTIGVLLLGTSIIFLGCKKTLPAPVFVVTYTSITLPGGSAGVEFFANCSTTDVIMTKVDILDPSRTNTVTYNFNNVTRVKGEIFALQDVGVGYLKSGGVYQFTFTGIREADNTGFGAVTTLNIAK